MNSFFRWWFNTITSRFLVYNTCWEDPLIDKELLKLNSDSSVLMITSAGDNALSYLLEQPSCIDCVDVNYRQNALLELKLSIIKHLDHNALFELFGKGKSLYYQQIYQQVRTNLSSPSKQFWDHHIHSFKTGGKGFYYSGLTGYFARLLNYILENKKLSTKIEYLLFEEDASEREVIYQGIREELFKGYWAKVWKWNGVLSLAGIPNDQKKAVGNLNLFMDRVFRKVFVENSGADNHFWRVYLEGSYTQESAPEYLKKENSSLLNRHIDRIHFENKSISQKLVSTPKRYSHFVLLDHMDWLASNNTQELEKEWRLIIQRASENARILFRTAFPDADFIPTFAREKLTFVPVDKNLLSEDRVGTYTNTYLAVLDV